MEVVLMSMLILELFLELFVIITKHPLHQKQVREYLGILPRHLLEQTHMAMLHVIIPDVDHGCRKHRLLVILGHDQSRVRAVGWYGCE